MSDLKQELCQWLDKQIINGETIGDIRRSLFVPWDSEWNGVVRDETAKRELSVPEPKESIEGKWAISGDSENYGSTTFATRDEAVAEGMAIYPDGFYLGRIVAPTQPEDRWSADDWLEHVSVQDDYSGEHAEDWDISTEEQREELETEVRKVMAAWLDRHGLRPDFWNVDEVEEIGESND